MNKGWLFTDSVAGAEAGTIIFSFVETCKYHGIEAYDWFRYVLQKLPSCQSDQEIKALMPFNINHTSNNSKSSPTISLFNFNISFFVALINPRQLFFVGCSEIMNCTYASIARNTKSGIITY